MGASDKQLTKRAKDLAAKFVADCQALFDDDAMTEALYDGEVMSSLVMAQGWADDAARAEA
jgi:hypothetical protein